MQYLYILINIVFARTALIKINLINCAELGQKSIELYKYRILP